jgi:predicted ATPase
MLTSIRLDNWKSFGQGEDAQNRVVLASLTFLVGPNASGKSNVLDALRFLQGAARGLPLSDVLRGRWEGQREVWPPIRGHVAEAARNGTQQFELETSWCVEESVLFPDVGPTTTHALRVDTEPDVLVTAEKLTDRNGYLFDTQAPSLGGATGRQPGGGLNVALRGSGAGRSPTQTHSSVRSLLGQITQEERVQSVVLEQAEYVQQHLKSATFLDIQPSAMRDYRPQGQRSLGVTGQNISPLLDALSRADGSQLEDITDWVSELVPEFERFEFDVTQLREVMLFGVERNGQRVSARSLSDGTLRFLGEAVAVLTAEPGQLMVLEEPDAGLHPSRVRALAELLEQTARDARVQILATTHSPALLAHLSKEALANAVVFGRHEGDGTTACMRLKELDHFDRLRESDRLSHLISTGWLERAL